MFNENYDFDDLQILPMILTETIINLKLTQKLVKNYLEKNYLLEILLLDNFFLNLTKKYL